MENIKKQIYVLKRLLKKGKTSKIFISVQNKSINFTIKDLNIYNVLSSIAVLKELKLNIYEIKSKFKNFELLDGRGKKYFISRYKKKFNLIDESYNANPLSVKNAINKLV